MTLQWLLPIGFLSLFGIGILLLIYIIRPSYQKRVISSSYAWQKVLKRKKELPIDRFRNVLLFLVQALILAACAMIFARPNLMDRALLQNTVERIVIIDASANMRAHAAGDSGGVTRFDRAIDGARGALNDILMKEDGLVSVIVADEEPYYLLDRIDRSGYSDAIAALSSLKVSNGRADMEKAIELTQSRALSPSTEVCIYSGTEYGDGGGLLKSFNLSDEKSEWNVAVSGCNVLNEDNEFVFEIELSAFGNVSLKKTLSVTIKGVDLGLETLVDLPALKIPVSFDVNLESAGYEERQTLRVKASDETIGGRADYLFTSFQSAEIEIEGLFDSIEDDDRMTVFGGVKDSIKIQYSSGETNVFYYLGFNIMRDKLSNLRDISFKQLSTTERPELSGYDIYIFEHKIPDVVLAYGLPKDGIVFLVDPDRDVEEIGYRLGDKVSFESLKKLSAGVEHPLTAYMNPARIGVTEYTRLSEYESDLVPLLYCGEDPVLFVKNTPRSKVVLMTFNLNMSDFFSWDFETMLYNMVTYFFPLTVTKYNYEYGDEVTLNCKGDSLVIANEKTSTVVRSFPTELKLDEIGTFTFTVKSGLERPDEVRQVMVRIPHSESALFQVSDLNFALFGNELYEDAVKDLFPYFAGALIAMLFVEWWLQFRSEA